MSDNTVISVLEFDEQIQAYFLVLSVRLHGFGDPAPTHTHTHTHPLKSLCSQISKNGFWATLIPKSQKEMFTSEIQGKNLVLALYFFLDLSQFCLISLPLSYMRKEKLTRHYR